MVIMDAWKEIGERIADGSYKTCYSIGDTKMLGIKIGGEEVLVEMQIAAFDRDILFDTYGKAPITWISKKVITTHMMNDTESNAGGWMLSDMRKYCALLYENILDRDAFNLIEPVRKSSYHHATKSSHITRDFCWIPSMSEIFDEEPSVEGGPRYAELFGDKAARRMETVDGEYSWWWLRSSSYDQDGCFQTVKSNGAPHDYPANSKNGIVFGFCTAVNAESE